MYVILSTLLTVEGKNYSTLGRKSLG